MRAKSPSCSILRLQKLPAALPHVQQRVTLSDTAQCMQRQRSTFKPWYKVEQAPDIVLTHRINDLDDAVANLWAAQCAIQQHSAARADGVQHTFNGRAANSIQRSIRHLAICPHIKANTPSAAALPTRIIIGVVSATRCSCQKRQGAASADKLSASLAASHAGWRLTSMHACMLQMPLPRGMPCCMP
jgi:hypothetical protein